MQEMQGAHKSAPIQGFILGMVALVTASTLVGCGGNAAAGALGSSSTGPESVAADTTDPTSAGPESESSERPSEQGSRTNSPQQRDTRVITAERIRIVNETIRRDAADVGLGTVHEIRVEFELPTTSAALLRVTRNGKPQTLAATVMKLDGAWFISNVDTLPDAQDLPW
ncbi:MAG: hypothetical protein WC054_07375 [Candidatus Nanopelagicales bacterium]